MLDLIKACEAESELDFLQESFALTEEQKEAVLQQRIIFLTNAMVLLQILSIIQYKSIRVLPR